MIANASSAGKITTVPIRQCSFLGIEHGEPFLQGRLLALVEHGFDAGQEMPVLLAASLEPVIDGSTATPAASAAAFTVAPPRTASTIAAASAASASSAVRGGFPHTFAILPVFLATNCARQEGRCEGVGLEPVTPSCPRHALLCAPVHFLLQVDLCRFGVRTCPHLSER